ncbi:MAG: type II toxin-antitoxin system HicB family antitoxin [Elusimicrobiota bacterium]
MTSTYNVNIRWSPADKSFLAEVPELPGCMADGPTRREALSNVERVIREWIETAQAEGRPIPKPGIQTARA